MKLPDIQNNESLRQREFPVCADKVYLAHAGVSPVPLVVTQAIHEVAAAAGLDEQEDGVKADGHHSDHDLLHSRQRRLARRAGEVGQHQAEDGERNDDPEIGIGALHRVRSYAVYQCILC